MRSRFRPRAARTVQFTVATTMLALPASAFAFTGSVGSDTDPSAPLPAHVTPRDLRLGAPLHVSGRLSSLQAGRTVVLESARSARGRWRRLASTRVGRHGGYALRVSPRQSGVLRTVELHPAVASTAVASTAASAASAAPASAPPAKAAAPAGPLAARRADAVSRVSRVEVRAAVRVAARVRGVLAGEEADVAGRLLPGRGGRRVAVQGLEAHHWRTLARGRTGGRGGFSVRVAPHGLSRGDLRVVFGGDRFNARATAGAGSVVVYAPVTASWYDDGAQTACGFHARYGVANLSLPCGTKVQLRRGGRTVTATVDDRGPYVAGREYDLDEATAGALGFSGVGTVEASVQ